MTTVLLVDDHTVFAETLGAVLDADASLTVVGMVHTAREGIEQARQTTPDVTLLDIGLPDLDGIEAARQIRTASPRTRVVMLTGETDPSFFPRAMAAGACGYLLKDAGVKDVISAVTRAAAGEVVVPASVAERMQATAAKPETGLGSDLTARELQILQHLSAGNDAKAISKAMGITLNTARSYIRDVRTKLGAPTQLDAVMTALRLGIIDAGPR